MHGILPCHLPGTLPALAAGHHTPSASTVTALWSLFTTGTCSGLHTALERRPVVQQQVLRWCARGIVMPESEQDAAVQDCDRCTCLRCMVGSVGFK